MGPTWKHANHRRRGMCRVKNYSLLEYAIKRAHTHTHKIIYEQWYIVHMQVQHLMGPLGTSLISPSP